METINPLKYAVVSLSDEERSGRSVLSRCRMVAQKVAELAQVQAMLEGPDLARMTNYFVGERAACLLRSDKVYVAHANPIAEALEKALWPIGGHLVIGGRNGRPKTRIQPRNVGDDQHGFLVMFERAGNPTQETKSEDFWSVSYLVPQVEGDENMPGLALALNLINDGNQFKLEIARSLYMIRSNDAVTGTQQVEDRLATLTNLANLEGVLMQIMEAAEFPFRETRQNRNLDGQGNRGAGRSQGRGFSGRSLVGAGVRTGASHDNGIPAAAPVDPFHGQGQTE